MSANVYEPARKLIEAHFKTHWETPTPRTPIKFENIPLTRPAASAWVALEIRWGASEQISIASVGNRDERHIGIVYVRAFVLKNQGTKPAVEHADFAAAGFRMKTLNDADVEIIFRTPRVDVIGETEDWFQVNMSVEFQVDARF